jgi:hypothetical protein
LVSFCCQTTFQYSPVVARIRALRQHLYHVHYGYVPFLALRIPHGADFPFLEQFYICLFRHLSFALKSDTKVAN